MTWLCGVVFGVYYDQININPFLDYGHQTAQPTVWKATRWPIACIQL